MAQSRCAHGGIPLARYWVHNGFVDMGAEKMSKSLGNIVTVGEMLEADDRGEIYRLALLTAHYRQPLSWTEALVEQSKAMLNRWYRAKATIRFEEELEVPQSVIDALNDDLNTPLALSLISEFASNANQARLLAEEASNSGSVAEAKRLKDKAAGYARQMWGGASLLGLLSKSSGDWFQREGSARVDLYVMESIAARAKAKARRDFAEADRIRDELKAEGIQLLDRADGTTHWERI
jgi:cysteinyl-tRNA synthetase